MASTVLGELPSSFCRTLFMNALSEACWIWQGGWNFLELPDPSSVDPRWTSMGQSTLFLSMHHGNWEWLAGLLYHLRPDTIGVARSAHHPLGQRILQWARAFHRTPVYYDRDAVLRAYRQMHRGGLVAFLADQRPPTGGQPGQWLNKPTLVTPLPQLWLTPGASLWTGCLQPIGSTRYRLLLQDLSAHTFAHWHEALDEAFLPLVQQSPAFHFGFFHRRLVSRETSRQA